MKKEIKEMSTGMVTKSANELIEVIKKVRDSNGNILYKKKEDKARLTLVLRNHKFYMHNCKKTLHNLLNTICADSYKKEIPQDTINLADKLRRIYFSNDYKS